MNTDILGKTCNQDLCLILVSRVEISDINVSATPKKANDQQHDYNCQPSYKELNLEPFRSDKIGTGVNYIS